VNLKGNISSKIANVIRTLGVCKGVLQTVSLVSERV